jgi:uncharacterized membrane protein
MNILEVLRVISGSFFVLFLPGLAWTYVFFEEDEIDIIERIVLSFGLSIALVPLIMFYLKYIFDIRINLVDTSATIIGLIATGLVIFAIKRRLRNKGMCLANLNQRL